MTCAPSCILTPSCAKFTVHVHRLRLAQIIISVSSGIYVDMMLQLFSDLRNRLGIAHLLAITDSQATCTMIARIMPELVRPWPEGSRIDANL